MLNPCNESACQTRIAEVVTSPNYTEVCSKCIEQTKDETVGSPSVYITPMEGENVVQGTPRAGREPSAPKIKNKKEEREREVGKGTEFCMALCSQRVDLIRTSTKR